MTSVTIFGDGNMGTAIADVLSAGGAAGVDDITTSTEDPKVTGDLVVLAVPFPAVADIAEKFADQLARQDRGRHHQPDQLLNLDSLTDPVRQLVGR